MISLFWEALSALPPGPVRLLECGSRRQPGQPEGEAANAHLYREGVEVVGLDAEAGEGVDVVADLCDLCDVGGTLLGFGAFDAVLICSTLEHVRRPWVVAKELARVTRPGGVLYCQTHFAFPLHAYPSDYFRFTADGLREVFSADAGWEVVAADHEFACKVVPLENSFPHARDWNFSADSWLNSFCLARRL